MSEATDFENGVGAFVPGCTISRPASQTAFEAGNAAFASPCSLPTPETWQQQPGFETGNDEFETSCPHLLGVNAGPDQTVVFGQFTALAGAVTSVDTATHVWSKISGPAGGVVVTPSSLTSQVTFTGPGVYVFRLSATAGDLSAQDDVTITVIANNPPVVNAGPDQTITLGSTAVLAGSVTDDGLPFGSVSTVWILLFGPATVTFSDINSLTPTVTFPAVGNYIFRLRASDGALIGSDEMTVTVQDVVEEGGCLCDLEELWSVWNERDSSRIIQVGQVFLPVPDGFVRHRGCLRFVRVSNGAISEDFGQPLGTPATTYLLSIAPTTGNLCYGVRFSGYRHRSKTIPTGWVSTNTSFTIFQVLCET